MHVKLFLVAVLGLSVSCFAESKVGQSGSLPGSGQAKNSQTESNQSASVKAAGKETESQSSQENSLDKKSMMIDYCRTHTC